MNRGDIVSMLEHEAKRRPVVADLLARAHLLTDDEINTAPVPLKWFRDALREARTRRQVTMQYEALAACAESFVIEDLATSENLKRGVTLEYTGANFWAKARRSFQIEIKTGDMFFFPEDGSGAWLNQTFFDKPPVQLRQSIKVAEETRRDYLLSYQKKLLSIAMPTQENVEKANSYLPQKGFQIFRPK